MSPLFFTNFVALCSPQCLDFVLHFILFSLQTFFYLCTKVVSSSNSIRIYKNPTAVWINEFDAANEAIHGREWDEQKSVSFIVCGTKVVCFPS
jgi:hypothetical protein